MKAIVFSGRNEVQFTELPDPKAETSDVVIEIKASGICHTDFEVLKDNYGTGAFPVVPGHEFAGLVVEIGSGVTNVALGDRVVVDPNLSCGTCRFCKRDWIHLCENLGAYGVTTHGGFAQYSLVDAARVHPIGQMSYSQAALAEPMGCVLNGVEAVHAPWMESALIFGAGPMGLLMGMALQAQGMTNVIFCDISDDRIKLAESSGFDALKSGSDDLRNWHQRADLVVDATGVPAVASQMTHYMANGGKGLFFGVCPSDARIDVSPFEIFRRQLTLAGSHSLNRNIPAALKVIAGLTPGIDHVVSHRLSLKEISGILKSAPPAGSLKVQYIAE